MEADFSTRMKNIKKSFIREILKAIDKPGMISFAGGLPNPLSFPVNEVSEAAQKVLALDGMNVLQYSTTEGYLPLREFICKRYKERMGLDASPDEVLITNGSQQALDLVGKVFLDAGDKVLIERPGYLGAIQALSLFEPRFLDVKLEDDGVDIDSFTRIISDERPKLFYCVPNFQNPTGVSYSYEKRCAVAEAVKGKNTVIVEDDPYGELRFMGEDQPSFKNLAPENTIMLGSFSKIVSPGMRLGWILAPGEIMDKLITAKQASDLHTNYFAQRVVYQYLGDNDIAKHIEKIKLMYKAQRDMMVDMIDIHFPKEVTTTKPQGGMFLWARLPQGMSALDVFNKAYEQNVAFVPGGPFYANDGEDNTFRLNYSNSSDKMIEEGIKRLGKILKEYIS